MIIPMLCVTIFVILVVWFLLPRVARLMIHTPTAISIFVCLSMVQLMAVFISMRSEDGSAGMPRPISYAVFCLKKKIKGKPPYVMKGGDTAGFLSRAREACSARPKAAAEFSPTLPSALDAHLYHHPAGARNRAAH